MNKTIIKLLQQILSYCIKHEADFEYDAHVNAISVYSHKHKGHIEYIQRDGDTYYSQTIFLDDGNNEVIDALSFILNELQKGGEKK